MIRLTALSIAAATILTPAAGFAQQGQPAVTVRYDDLNIGDAAGARVLARRIDAAAEYVCGGRPASAAERGANQEFEACRREAASAALTKIGSPQLAATIEGRRLLKVAGR